MKDDAHVKRRLSTFCSHFNIIWKYKCHYCFEYDEYSLHIYWAIAPQNEFVYMRDIWILCMTHYDVQIGHFKKNVL